MHDYDPDIVVGYNLTGYDIPQILHRARFHGLKGYKKILNRDNSEWGWEAPSRPERFEDASWRTYNPRFTEMDSP